MVNDTRILKPFPWKINLSPDKRKTQSYEIIEKPLIYHCVNKRCSSLDKEFIIFPEELAWKESKIITPKCLTCNKQIAFDKLGKDTILVLEWDIRTGFTESLYARAKMKCWEPLRKIGLTERGHPIWFCDYCDREVFGYNHLKKEYLHLKKDNYE